MKPSDDSPSTFCFLALDPERGKYGSNRTRRYEQMRKYQERLFGGPRHAAPLLDRQLTWTAFAPAEVHRSYLAPVFRDQFAESIGRYIRHLHAFRRETGVSPGEFRRRGAARSS